MTMKEARRLLQIGHAELELEDDSGITLRIPAEHFRLPSEIPAGWKPKMPVRIRVFKVV